MSQGASVTVAGRHRHRARFRLARELGIPRTAALDDETELEMTARGRDGLGVGVVVECSGATDAVAVGLRLLRKGGRMIQVAFTPGRTVPMDLDLVVQRELAIVASRGKRPSCFRVALNLLETGAVRTLPLVSHRFRIDDYAEAFETAARSGTKVVIEIGGEETARAGSVRAMIVLTCPERTLTSVMAVQILSPPTIPPSDAMPA